jgi:hypothetical protein
MTDKTKTEFEKVGTANANAVNTSGTPSANTHLAPRHNTQSGQDGATANHRLATLERNGFQGAPQVAYSYPQAPEAAQVGRNVHLMPSAKGNRDFYARRSEAAALVAPPFPSGSWTPPTKP